MGERLNTESKLRARSFGTIPGILGIDGVLCSFGAYSIFGMNRMILRSFRKRNKNSQEKIT